nr:hypothetical protein [Tanacetum cinerariifolium]
MNLVVCKLYWTILSRKINTVATQQVALDNSLVVPEKRLKIEKVNARIAFSKPQIEETNQVTLDALKLSPYYPTFLITVEVPKVYMHQFWKPIQMVKDIDAYRKQGSIRNLLHPLEKLSHVLEEEPAEMTKRARKPVKKYTKVPTTVLLKAAQVKEALKKSKKDSHMLHASGSGDGVSLQPKIPDESEYKITGKQYDDSDDVTKNDDEDDVESDANEDKEGSDSEKTDSDEDENLNVNLNDDEEEEHEVEYVRTPNSFEFNIDDEDVLPVVDEVAYLINVKTPNEESSIQAPLILSVPMKAIPKTSIVHATTAPLLIQPFSSILQMITPTPIPTTEPTTSLIPALLNFASLFRFN